VEATVYIPTFNSGTRLLATLRALLLQSHPCPIVVVDNGSTDSSLEQVRSELPEVKIVELGWNHGFGPALNRAVHAHPSRLLVFLNDDVECEPRFLEAILESLGSGIGMVAGVLLQHRRPGMIDSAGIVVDQTLMAFDYLHGEPATALEDAKPPLGPTGGAALFRAEDFIAAGGFDERIFAYLEDVDLALRLRLREVRCSLAVNARALHRHSSTLGSGSSSKNWHMGWTRGYMLRRYGVLSRARDVPRVLAAETVICGGQAIVDRTLAGVRGRASGWRAARDLERRSIPPDALNTISLRSALRWRSRRRPLPATLIRILGESGRG
jgi:N-acetylglucosaminyl-diphospho-decaprenol L-rhamnosyltransferase